MKPTQEQVIAWARAAGAGEPQSLYGRTDYIVMTKFDLGQLGIHIYEAGRKDENEAINEKYPIKLTHDQYNAVINAALKDENEACAKFIEQDYVRQFDEPWRDNLAAAIRARREQ